MRLKTFLFCVMLIAASGVSSAVDRDTFDCVYINEICFKNRKISDGNGSFDSDWVELYNPRSFPVNIGGYAIGLKSTWAESEKAGKLFVLPSYTMSPGEFFVVFFNPDLPAATTRVDRKVNGKTKSVPVIRSDAFSLGTNGDKTLQDSVRLFVPTYHTRVSNFKGEDIGRVLDADTSYGWVYDGTFDRYGRQNIARRIFPTPTPWASNAGGTAPAVPDPTLRINEVCYSNSKIDDGTGNLNCDFVELYNPGPDAVELGGMQLGKKANVADCGTAVLRLPDYRLAAGESFVVYFDKNAAPFSGTATRIVNGESKSVPLVRSNVFSLGKGYSTEVPGSEGTNVVVQDSIRLFAAEGWRIDNFKGEEVAAAFGVTRNSETGEWESLLPDDTSVGYRQDGVESSGLVPFWLPTPWNKNAEGFAEPIPMLRINEVCYSNSTVDDGTGNRDCDFVEIYNADTKPVALKGMKLGKKGTLEKCADAVFTFPDYTMSPGEFFTVFFNKDVEPSEITVTRDVNGESKSVPLIRSNALSFGTGYSTEVPGSEGTNVVVQDSVRLFAADGRRIDSFKGEAVAAVTGVVKNPVTGEWEALVEDDASVGPKTDGSDDLALFRLPTPWGANAAGVADPLPLLKINEVCYSNSTVDDGTGNRDCDFVEIYNADTKPVALRGMKLGKKSTLEKCADAVFTFPDYTMSPGEFFTVFFNKDVEPSETTVTRDVNGESKSVPLIRSNALTFGTGYSTEVPGSEGTNVVVQDSVRLFAADGRRIDSFKGEAVAAVTGVVKNPVTGEWEALLEDDASVGPKTDGSDDLALFRLPTPWGANAAGVADPLPLLKINEVCYSNSTVDDGTGNRDCDFVEIYNADTKPVALKGVKLGKKGTLEKCADAVFTFPDYTLSPGEFFTVFFTKDVEPSETSVTRDVNGESKSVPLIRSNVLSFGTGYSTEVPGSEGTNVVVQDSVRLFAADGRRIDSFKGEAVAAVTGVVKNPVTGEWEALLEDDASVGPKTDGSDDLALFRLPTPWGANAAGVADPLPLLKINEVCYSNSTVDDGTGNKDCDFVEIYNADTMPVALKGMKLGKKSTLEKCADAVFTFPDYTMSPGEFFTVFFNKDVEPSETTVTRDVNGESKSVPLIRSNALSFGTGYSTEVPGSEGTNVVVQDSARLFAADGRRIDSFKGESVAAVTGVVKNPVTGEWEALVEEEASVGPLTDGADDLIEIYQPTPWGPNAAGTVRKTVVVINEVCYSNSTVDDGTGNLESDWVEIYNAGPGSVELEGMKLGKKSTLEKCGTSVFTFPAYTLASNEFLVVFFDKNLPSMTTWTTRLVNGTEKSVPVFRSNVFSLGTDSSDEVPGYEGQAVVVQDSVRLFAADGTRLSNFKGDDVATAVGVRTVGGVLSGLLGDGQTYGYLWDGNRLLSGATPPEDEKGRFVLARETAWGPNAAGYALSAPAVTGSVPGRYAAEQKIGFAAAEGKTIRYTTDGSDPRVSPTAITCVVGDEIVIGTSESATATSGGSLTNAWIRTSPAELATKEPNAAWRAPIGSVGRASVLRAVAAVGPAFSAEYRGTWYIGSGFSAQSLPLVSVIADEADLFSDEKGIYVPGGAYKTNGYGGNKWGKPYANYYGDGEIAAHVELVEPGADAETLAIDAGLAINGGGTRSLPQKALYVKMKSAYGAKNFTYDLIPSVGVRTYRRFLLRPNGNDWYGPYTDGVSTMMKDAVFHRIVGGLDMYTMAYRPAVVYVNGSYWGIHNLRESVDKQAFATRYGLNEDLIDVLTHEEAGSSDVSISLIDGSETAVNDYRNWLQQLKNASITTAAGYKLATDRMDVTNYIDYIATECFFANTDWPVNNCDFWRSSANQTAVAGKYGDGRWRWALYDLDLAGLVVDGVGGVNRNMLTYLSGSNMTGVYEPGFLFNRLLANASFKNEFIRRYTELLNTTFRPERVEAVITAAADEIEDEIETHYRRWGREFTKSDWRQAVGDALVSYTAQRWTNSFNHASLKFALGGVGEIRVMNDDPTGLGGHFVVDGTVIDAGTDGVTDRADWTGRYYPGRPVTVVAVPDAGYVFDGWTDATETASRTVTVTANGKLEFKARFRPASATPAAPAASLASPSAFTGFAAWQAANCDARAVSRGAEETRPDAVAVSKGGRAYTNRELFAFGITRTEAEALTADELRLRTSLKIGVDGGLRLQYSCSPYGGAETAVMVRDAKGGDWRRAVVGEDIGPAETNRSERDSWTVTVPLTGGEGSFYKLEIKADGR